MKEITIKQDEKIGKSVDARELHQALDSKKQFANWITERIEQYGFEKGTDYEVFHQTVKNPKGGRPSTDYMVSVDMAKELAMVERTEKGKQVRKYFIECEKQARSGNSLKGLSRADLARMVLEQESVIRLQDKVMDKLMPQNLHLYGTADDKGRVYRGLRRSALVRAASRCSDAAELLVESRQLELGLLLE